MTTILRGIIAAMDPAALAGLHSAETMQVDDSYYARARPDMLLLVPENARRVLDIGCGAGLVGAALKQRQVCHVTGIELFADAAMHANRVLDLAICGDAMQVLRALPDQAYDCVLLLDVIEHVGDSAELLRRAAAKLTREGTLLLSVPNVGHWSVIQGLLQGRWDYADQGVLDRTHLRFFTLRSLYELLQETGLQVVRVTSTRIDGEPSEAVVEAVRRSTPAGYDMDANLKAYQFIFFCRRL
jgi:predicted TPR repeat methyltransferase